MDTFPPVVSSWPIFFFTSTFRPDCRSRLGYSLVLDFTKQSPQDGTRFYSEESFRHWNLFHRQTAPPLEISPTVVFREAHPRRCVGRNFTLYLSRSDFRAMTNSSVTWSVRRVWTSECVCFFETRITLDQSYVDNLRIRSLEVLTSSHGQSYSRKTVSHLRVYLVTV